jgi:NADP-dependent 3-hydroxy acid dehydrogenase YdfG
MPLAAIACLYFGWSRITSVHFKCELDGIAAALPHMKQKKSGYIIKVSSLNGHEAGLRFAIYAQAMHLVRAMSKGLRQEGKPLQHSMRPACAAASALATLRVPRHLAV